MARNEFIQAQQQATQNTVNTAAALGVEFVQTESSLTVNIVQSQQQQQPPPQEQQVQYETQTNASPLFDHYTMIATMPQSNVPSSQQQQQQQGQQQQPSPQQQLQVASQPQDHYSQLAPRKSPVPLNSHTGPGPLSPSGRGPLPTPKANAAVPGNRPLPVANSGTYIQTDIDTLRHRYILTYTYTHTCDTHTQHR